MRLAVGPVIGVVFGVVVVVVVEPDVPPGFGVEPGCSAAGVVPASRLLTASATPLSSSTAFSP